MRQYIGARYVPRFSEVNNGIWSNVYSYEPLTIVKNGNDYYTSKQSVPVGVAITNTDYWIKTGDYNGAIAHLQDKINTLETALTNDINTLETALTNDINKKTGAIFNYYNNKKIHFFGDSYAEGAICISLNPNQYTRNYADGWMSKLIALLGMDSAHAIPHDTGGASFALDGGTHWQDQINSMDYDEDVDMVVLAGGANDFPATYSDIIKGITTFCNNAKAKFPNAVILIGMIGYSRWSTSPVPCERTYRAYRDGAIINGAVYMSGIENVSHIGQFMSLDNLHLNADGYTNVARQIANIMKSGACDFEIQTSLKFTHAFQSAQVNIFYASEQQQNGLQIMNIRLVNIGTITGFTIQLSPSVFTKIGILANNNMIGRDDYGIYGDATLIFSTSGGFKLYNGWVKIVGSDVYITAASLVNNAWETIEATGLQILNCRLISCTLDAQ